MRQNYIRELTKAIHIKEKGLVASSQRFYHLTKLMDAMHDVGTITYPNHVLAQLQLCWIQTQIWNLSCVIDSEEDQPVLSEHLHPGRLYESGVSRDDVRGHCLPASQGPGRHGETSPISQVTGTAETPPFCQDWLDYSPFIYWMFNCVCFCHQTISNNLYILLKKKRMNVHKWHKSFNSLSLHAFSSCILHFL